ncbi:MAG: hypothetical protein J6U58_07510 [Bacteroidaceae bacterium]|nr:hypothetical protein [Bacteroidaceae bacterium]
MSTATFITSLQIASLIMMLGTIDAFFVEKAATILFILSFATFARCSIFISKNEKWLTRINNQNNN